MYPVCSLVPVFRGRKRTGASNRRVELRRASRTVQLFMMRALLFLAAAFVSSASTLLAARPVEPAGPRSGRWAHEVPKSIAPDPHVIWGRLDNGFRYALL